MNQIDFDSIWYTLKFLVFLYFLDCGYIHVHVLVYGQNFHKIMYCDVIRHVSPLIPDVAASIFRKNFKRVLFFSSCSLYSKTTITK